tara:strand:- start:3566 stop:4726 length:1161 start_codon:yes stop_codon:yes gene_type:complete
VAKTNIVLHAGHGKTGTSAIQSALAISTDDLLKQGINYPIDANEQKRAARFEITSGNWKHNPNVSLADQCIELAASNKSSHTIALSSESLFWHLSDFIEQKGQWHDAVDIHVVLAVRELEEMLSSEYQQRVKRHGEKRPFEQFLKRRQFISSHHKKAAEVLEQLSKHKIKTTLINYSQHKSDIAECIFEAMDAKNCFPKEQMRGLVINRSLSQKELQILTMINALYYDQFPWISARLSDALAKQLPHTETQRSRISLESLEKLYQKNEDYLQTINSYLDANEPLTCLKSLDRDRRVINDPQKNQKIRAEEEASINLIGRTLLEALRNDPSKQLSNDTVDALIKTSQADDTPAHVEVELLELAKLNRPQGQRLSQLLEQAQIKKHQA